MLLRFRSKESLYHEMNALSAMLRKLQSSGDPTVQRKCWKLASKIRRIDTELRDRQLPLWNSTISGR